MHNTKMENFPKFDLVIEIEMFVHCAQCPYIFVLFVLFGVQCAPHFVRHSGVWNTLVHAYWFYLLVVFYSAVLCSFNKF